MGTPEGVPIFGINWLPLVDALRNQLTGSSKGMVETILIAQSEAIDGLFEIVT